MKSQQSPTSPGNNFLFFCIIMEEIEHVDKQQKHQYNKEESLE